MDNSFKGAALVLALPTVTIAAACAEPGVPVATAVSVRAVGAEPKFTTFESGQVRPLALLPDRSQLFAVNTPDGQVEVFEVKDNNHLLNHKDSVPVGLEPVAVAALSGCEVWVVNHLSDSVSILNKSDGKWRVVRTLLVGDEPRDIVFGGANGRRAFITTAHRGQNSPIDPQLTTKSVGRSDVWVFDADNLGSAMGGTPIGIVELFSDTPRALAVSPDGTYVYVAAFNSGNRTTTIPKDMTPLTAAEGGPPPPETNYAGFHRDRIGQLVRYDGQHWVDKEGSAYDAFINFSLPDKDVFVIDATATPPAPVAGPAGYFTGVGTTLFNMVVNPVNGNVYVSNTEALNHVRFEGPGVFSGGETVRGHLAENRITVLTGTSAAPRHLNKHIDYSQCCAVSPNSESVRSLAIPLEMVVTSTGGRLYVAAMGSDKVGVFSTQALETDAFVPDAANHISVTGGGPTGLVLDEGRDRLYVMTRFDNGISILDTVTRQEIGHLTMFNPEPASVVDGRRFLYDAQLSSSHGDSSCASCHVFGDMDQLAWDLGDPDGDLRTPPGPFKSFPFLPIVKDFHPMKGPMTTQSLRGMANHGPLHWRGDRTGGYNEASAQPDQGSFDEEEAFRQFNVAFPNLQGRSAELTAPQMQAFTDFALQLTYPPNPIRALDNSLTPEQEAGREIFFTAPVVQGITCESCHTLDPNGNAEYGVAAPGFFGTDGTYVGACLDQAFKIPHFRNLYQKVGMFGMVPWFVINEELDPTFTGDQVRGFGFFNDGSFDTVARFIQGFADFPTGHPLDNFNPTGFPQTPAGRAEREWVESFLLAFDSNLAPIVGQQVTLTGSNGAIVGPRIDLLIARADAGECELVARSRRKSYLYAGGVFEQDKAGVSSLSDAQLRGKASVAENEVTYTCVPNGSGRRMGLDRDLDGILNRDK